MARRTTSRQPVSEKTVFIRKAAIGDVDAVSRLHKVEGWCYDDAIVLNDYWDDSFDKESILIAEVDEKIVGTLEISKAYKARFGFFAVLRRFVVDSEYRGRGVGRQLMSFALEEARRMGCSAIELSVDPENTRPHDFYKKLGFRDDRTETIMVKILD
jgi:GNAT superfamily N-acetyltransferase